MAPRNQRVLPGDSRFTARRLGKYWNRPEKTHFEQGLKVAIGRNTGGIDFIDRESQCRAVSVVGCRDLLGSSSHLSYYLDSPAKPGRIGNPENGKGITGLFSPGWKHQPSGQAAG
jgi:hypothetical protein